MPVLYRLTQSTRLGSLDGQNCTKIEYMRIALTHEQADFDALGALLGAHLLDESLLPVLPRRINRNGRAFLTLYGADLPFVDPRDLPSEPIESVLLVDTQSLVTLKGLSSHTRVQVVDHHTPRPDLPSEWSVNLGHTGACTTLLIENLQEQNGTGLTPSQATLLLLGIYEDTGSLSYAGTTARDARAAAYLIEQGADLSVLATFLNPPLSTQQLSVYESLLNNTRTLTIHGQTVVVACAEAPDIRDEISSVAHKLREVLDPDGLFILVTTGEGIRLIARSSTDRINVAAIAAVFGGGGHERASAALIQPERTGTLESTCQTLIDLLPAQVKPTITVGQIMSRHPRLLSPHTSVHEAAQLMARYGYEGYPVVQDGEVIGLLTRRAVDRAINHKLNVNAASLMDAGSVHVEPGHSVEHLQRVMAASGWGQVPVIDQERGEIVGIVTRTDLIKTLAPRMGEPSPQNLASRLEAALPPARLALLKKVATEAYHHHNAIYIVGGFVRDLLLERPSLDFDVVVDGDAISLARSLSTHLGGRVISHGRFGTAKWHIADDCDRIATSLAEPDPSTGDSPYPNRLDPAALPDSLDIISARTEYYEHPTALPTVERSGIKLDLHRRDFTINTMALRLDGRHYGELHDYWGGLNDLHHGLVRVLHSLSFIDDPTRLLRAVRFEQRFGFAIENRTLELMKEAQTMLKQVSGERLHHELDLILAEERAASMLARLETLGILSAIHPALMWKPAEMAGLPTPGDLQAAATWQLPQGLAGLSTLQAVRYLTWLGPLPLNQLTALGQRLKLHGGLMQALKDLNHLLSFLPGLESAPASQVVHRLDKCSLLAIFTAYWLTPRAEERLPLQHYVLTWRSLFPTLDGHDLERRGLPPSPAYRTILDSLRNAWLDGKIHSVEEEQIYLEELIRQENHPSA